jgi:histidine ammonia-lyase
MAGLAALAVHDASILAKIADIAASLSLEALHGVPYAFDPRTHALRPHTGQKLVAENIRTLIEGSEIIENFKGNRVQDAYSLRCVPQVHGASRDALEFVRGKIDLEINSVTDNPIIFPADGIAISGGNFHGQPIALAMDFFGIAAAELANISERRVARLVDHKLSGLPPFLVQESGLNSGFMIPQYTCAALVSENKVLSHPASVDSIPTSAGQEDHVSMGAHAARKARTILENAFYVLSIEILAAAQGIDFSRPLKAGKGTEAAHGAVRRAVPFYEKDCLMEPLIQAVHKITRSGKLVADVESAIGDLH